MAHASYLPGGLLYAASTRRTIDASCSARICFTQGVRESRLSFSSGLEPRDPRIQQPVQWKETREVFIKSNTTPHVKSSTMSEWAQRTINPRICFPPSPPGETQPIQSNPSRRPALSPNGTATRLQERRPRDQYATISRMRERPAYLFTPTNAIIPPPPWDDTSVYNKSSVSQQARVALALG